MKRINIYIPDDMYKKLKELETSMSSHIVAAVYEYLARLKGLHASASQSKKEAD